MFGILKNVLIVLSVIYCASCSSSKPASEKVESNKIQEAEFKKSILITNFFKARYGFLEDQQTVNYISSIVNDLCINDLEIKSANLKPKINILNTNEVLSLAGVNENIYISKGVFKITNFENELAYLLSVNISLLKNKIPQKKVLIDENDETIVENLFMAGGFFDYSYKAYEDANRESIRIMQSSRYDHRGAVHFLKKMNEPILQRKYNEIIKFEPSLLDQLLIVKSEVASKTPIRNPILKSKKFEENKARLNK